MKRTCFALAIAAFLGSAVAALAIPCGGQSCCICTKHSGCVRPAAGQWGTYACEESCTGAPLPLDCMGLPAPRGESDIAVAWRFLTPEEYQSQFSSFDPVLSAAAAQPIAEPVCQPSPSIPY